MTQSLLYLVKANVVLTLFVAAYYGLLRQLTFFRLNRLYLVTVVLFAAVYPSISFPAWLPASAASIAAAPTWMSLPASRTSPITSPLAWDWQALILRSYCLGAGLLIGRLLVQLLSMALVHRRARPAVVLGQPVRLLSQAKGSFSFGRSIYLNEAVVTNAAALAPELRHEQAHVRQWHTLDVVLAQLITALAWCNPAAWLWRRAVLENLEYLADQATLQSGLERQAYQYSLLRQQPGWVPAPALGFRFSASELKKRIVMLNQPASSRRLVYRYLLIVPTIMVLALSYSGTQARPGADAGQGAGLPVDALYYLDGQASDRLTIQRLAAQDISSVDVVEGAAAIRRAFANSTFNKAIVVTTKARAETRAVRELADRANLGSGYLIRTLPVQALPPASLNYIAQHYPQAHQSGEVREYTKKTTGAVELQVQLASGNSLVYVYFLPTGEFLRDDVR